MPLSAVCEAIAEVVVEVVAAVFQALLQPAFWVFGDLIVSVLWPGVAPHSLRAFLINMLFWTALIILVVYLLLPWG